MTDVSLETKANKHAAVLRSSFKSCKIQRKKKKRKKDGGVSHVRAVLTLAGSSEFTFDHIAHTERQIEKICLRVFKVSLHDDLLPHCHDNNNNMTSDLFVTISLLTSKTKDEMFLI